MTQKDYLSSLRELRRALHRKPEIAGEESATAVRIKEFLHPYGPDRIVENIGGYGMIAEFSSGKPGPTVMFRCELDALPIEEKNNIPYSSSIRGKAHLCGHDGHMSMVAGLARYLKERRPDKGRVLLLFQPSEENGQGADKMLKDPALHEFSPDYIFAIHNLPGFPLHRVVLSNGYFAAASRGMIIRLTGKSSHAAEPEKGINPALSMAKLIKSFYDILKVRDHFKDFVLITPIHARLGTLAYGTSPGEAVIHLTLRSYLDEDMNLLTSSIEQLIKTITRKGKVVAHIAYEEIFPATRNDAECTRIVKQAGLESGLEVDYLDQPFRWSEDFGHFTSNYRGVLFGLGSGIDQPALHNPDYDFPDDLLPTGIEIFRKIYRFILND